MTTKPIDKLLPKLHKVTSDGKGWKAQCPIANHGKGNGDEHPSLSIAVANDGTVLLKCFAGCETESIVSAVGLTMADLFVNSKGPKQKKTLVATYDYVDANGNLLYQVLRYEPKGFKQRRPDGKGGWIRNLTGVKRVLYNLPAVMNADPWEWVFVAEGEKSANAVSKLKTAEVPRFIVTTNSGGALSWLNRGKPVKNHIEPLKGRCVVILQDNDEAGRKRTVQVGQSLMGVADEVHVVELPGLEYSQDVEDWLDAGGTAEKLLTLVENAPEYKPQAESATTPETIRLLDEHPNVISRPLCLVDGIAYASTWLPVEIEKTEIVTSSGDIIPLDPPEVTTGVRLFVVRDDGKVFGPTNDMTPLSELGLEVKLPTDFSPIGQTNKLMSTAAVRNVARGYSPEPVSVFQRVVSAVDRFIDFDKSLAPQLTMAEMIGCYVLATWFLDAFVVIGYVWPNGEKGSGKTQLLVTAASLSYLGQVILSGGSFASLRDLADLGATLAFDDAEGLTRAKDTDPDKRSLLLAGNRKGSCTVTVKELTANKTWVTRHVNAFCPRLFSAIRLPDNVLASRTIVVPLIRTADRVKANADPADNSKWPIDQRKLIDDLWALGLRHLSSIPDHTSKVDTEARLTGRALEPWRNILTVALWLDAQDAGGTLQRNESGLWERMEELSYTYATQEQPNLNSGDLTLITIRALCRLVSKAIEDKFMGDFSELSEVSELSELKVKIGEFWFFLSHDVTEKIKEMIEDGDVEYNKEWVSVWKVGRVLSQIRLQKKREGGTGKSGWLVSLDDLVHWTSAYNVPFLRSLGLDSLEGTFTNFTNFTNFTDVKTKEEREFEAMYEEVQKTGRVDVYAFADASSAAENSRRRKPKQDEPETSTDEEFGEWTG